MSRAETFTFPCSFITTVAAPARKLILHVKLHIMAFMISILEALLANDASVVTNLGIQPSTDSKCVRVHMGRKV